MSSKFKTEDINIIKGILRRSDFFVIEAVGKDGELKTLSKEEIEKMSIEDIKEFTLNFDPENYIIKALIKLKRDFEK